MYAHQAIEDLKKAKFVKYDSLYKKSTNKLISKTNTSVHFHLPEMNSVWDLYRKSITGKKLFKESLNIRLPFDCCWFDYDVEDNGIPVSKGQYHSQKRGILAVNTGINNLIKVNIVDYFGEPKKMWRLSFVEYFVLVNDSLRINKNALDYIASFYSTEEINHLLKKDANIFPHPILNYEKFNFENVNKVISTTIEEGKVDLQHLACSLDLINCKNITTQDIYPDKKLNNKRKKYGKRKLFTYKTLIIKPTGKKQKSQALQGLWDNRIHLCRGHFKEYTAEKPLFGKITGRYWWQPSIRGNAKNGMIVKDYEVKG